jgi:predicted MFS family arabinose efflux permease
VTAPALFLAPSPPAALALTLLHGLGQGVANASTLGLLLGRYAPLRGAVLALNAAGTNLGAFAGPALAGAALAAGGYPGLAATVGVLALLAAAAGLSARTRARRRELSG